MQTGNPTIRYAAGDGKYALDFTDGSRNCIADHLSLSWSTNKILSTTKMSDLITVQWCILSESLNIDGHGYASITSGNRVSWHRNLFAHNYSRNVRFQAAVDADFRNNLIYDWGRKRNALGFPPSRDVWTLTTALSHTRQLGHRRLLQRPEPVCRSRMHGSVSQKAARAA